MKANTTSISRPNTATHSSGVASGRKPISSATPIMPPMASAPWISVPTTCPVSMADCAIDITRNRLTMPLVLSVASDTATDTVRYAGSSNNMPGAR